MSRPRPSDAPNATRQMLDELDVLMERMLALPVNDLGDAAPAAPKPADRPALSATLTVVESSSPAPPREASKILVGRLTPSYTTPLEEEKPVSTPPTSVGEARFSVPVESGLTWQQTESAPLPEQVLPPLIQPGAAGSLKPLHRRRSKNPLLQPLLWINRHYDRFTHKLGLPGRWLRSVQGRMVLGYLGLTLLGVAIAWSVRDWFGWWW